MQLSMYDLLEVTCVISKQSNGVLVSKALVYISLPIFHILFLQKGKKKSLLATCTSQWGLFPPDYTYKKWLPYMLA